MMLEDIESLLRRVPAEAGRSDYVREVVDANLLGKPTKKARELGARHLVALYALDPAVPMFRALRRLWDADPAGHPVMALLMSLARDALLRDSAAVIQDKHPGEVVSREEMERRLEATRPGRFSAASLKSFAQNLNGSWTQAGFLAGKARKTRAQPVVTFGGVAFALFLAYLQGLSGQQLFSSSWVKLLGCGADELDAHARTAAARDLLVHMHAGGVREVRFPGYLTAEEEQLRHEAAHVV